MNADISVATTANSEMTNGGKITSLQEKLQRSKRFRQQIGSDSRSLASGNSLASPCSHDVDERHVSDPISPRSLSIEKRESLVERRRRVLQKNRCGESENTSRTSPESSSSKSGRSNEISEEPRTEPAFLAKSKVVKTSSLFSKIQNDKKTNGVSESYVPCPEKPEDNRTNGTSWQNALRPSSLRTSQPTASRAGTAVGSEQTPFSKKLQVSSPAPKEPGEIPDPVASTILQDENSNSNATSQDNFLFTDSMKSVSVASLRASFTTRSQAAQLVARSKTPAKTPHNTPVYDKSISESVKDDNESKLLFSPPQSSTAFPASTLPKQQLGTHLGTSPAPLPTGEKIVARNNASPFHSPFSKTAPKPHANPVKPTSTKSLFKTKGGTAKHFDSTPPPIKEQHNAKLASAGKQLNSKLSPAVEQVDLTPPSPKASSFDAARHRFAEQRSPPLPKKTLPKPGKASPLAFQSPAPTSSPMTTSAHPSWQRRNSPSPVNGNAPRPYTPPSKISPFKAAQSPSPSTQLKPSLSWQQRSLPSPPLTKAADTPHTTKPAKSVPAWKKRLAEDEVSKPSVRSWNRQFIAPEDEKSLTPSVGSELSNDSEQPKSPSRPWKVRSESAQSVLQKTTVKAGSPFHERRVKGSAQTVETASTKDIAPDKPRFDKIPPWVKRGPAPSPAVKTGFVSSSLETNLASISSLNDAGTTAPLVHAESFVSSLPSPAESSVHEIDAYKSEDECEKLEHPVESEAFPIASENELTTSNKSLMQMAADSNFAADYHEAMRFQNKLNEVYSLDEESQMSSIPGKLIPHDLPEELRKALDADPPLELPGDLETSANTDPEASREADHETSANLDPPLELPGDHSADDSSDDGLPVAATPVEDKAIFARVPSSPRSDPSQKRGRKVYRSLSPRGLMAKKAFAISPSSKTRRKEVSPEIFKKMQALNLAKSPTDFEPSIIFGDPATFGAAGGEIPKQAPRISDRAKAIEDWNGGRGKPPSPSVSRSPQRSLGLLTSPGSERALNFARGLKLQELSTRRELDEDYVQDFFPSQIQSADFEFSNENVHRKPDIVNVGDWNEGSGTQEMQHGVDLKLADASQMHQLWSRKAHETDAIEPVVWSDEFAETNLSVAPEVPNDEVVNPAETTDVGAGWQAETPSRSPTKVPTSDSSNRQSSNESFFPPDDPFDVSFAYSFLSSPPRSVRGEVFDPFFSEEDFDGFGGPQGFFPPPAETDVLSTKAIDGNVGDISASSFFPENAATPKSRGGDILKSSPKDAVDPARAREQARLLMLPTMQHVAEEPKSGGFTPDLMKKNDLHHLEAQHAAYEVTDEQSVFLPAGPSPRLLRPPPARPGIPRPSTPNRRKPILMKQRQLAQAYDDNYALSLSPGRASRGQNGNGDFEVKRAKSELTASDWDDDFNFEV